MMSGFSADEIQFHPSLLLHFMFYFVSPVGLYVQSSGTSMCILEGQQGGVTHMIFSPDGEKLYSGGRKVSFSCMMGNNKRQCGPVVKICKV